MSGEQDDITVICARWSEKTRRRTPGAIVERCSGCRRRLIVAPAGQRVEPDPGFSKRYLCIGCAQAESPDEMAAPAPGSLEEAAKVIGPANAIIAGSQMGRTKLKDFDPKQIDGDA